MSLRREIASFAIRRFTALLPLAIARTFDHPSDLFFGRVAGTAEPDQALVGEAEPLDDGHRVKVTVRGEDPSVGKESADLLGRPARNGEGECRRARCGGRRSIKLDALDLARGRPRAVSRARPAFVKGLEHGLQPLAPRTGGSGRSRPGERGEIIDRGGRADDSLMVLRAGLQPFGRGIGGGLELGKVERLQPLSLAVEHADVRPMKFVRRARQEIAAPFADVDQLVRRIVHGIDERKGLGLACHGDGPGHVVDRSQRIGRRPDRQQLDAMVAQTAVQVVPIELAGLRDHPNLEDRDAPLALECPPGIDIGVMVELGDDDRIAWPQPSPEGPRQMKRQCRHVEPKADLGRRGIEKVRHGLPRIRECSVGFGAGGKPPVRVGIVMNKIIDHGLDDRRGDLRPAWSVEVGGRMTMMDALECGEVRADQVGRGNGRPDVRSVATVMGSPSIRPCFAAMRPLSAAGLA